MHPPFWCPRRLYGASVDDSPCSFPQSLKFIALGWLACIFEKNSKKFLSFSEKKLLLLTMPDYEVLPSENISWHLSFFDQNWGALLLLKIEVDNSLVPVHIRDIHLYNSKRNHPLIRRTLVKTVAFYVSNAWDVLQSTLKVSNYQADVSVLLRGRSPSHSHAVLFLI